MRLRKALATVVLASLPLLSCAAVVTAAEGSFERTLRVTGPVDLDIASASGDIRVQAGGEGQVMVRAEIQVRRSFGGNAQELIERLETNPPIDQDGNTIRIGRIEDREIEKNVSIDYEVSVPAQTQLKARSGSGDLVIGAIRGPVETQAGSGDLSISEIQDSVEAQTGSGDVDLNAIEGAVQAAAGSGDISAMSLTGDLRATSGSGDVEVKQSALGDAEVKTGSGDILIEEVLGALRANTGSGTISAQGAPSAEWEISSASGDVNLRLPADAAFDIAARATSGGITIDHPVTAQGNMSRKRVEGKIRGGGPLVSVKTASGSIRVE